MASILVDANVLLDVMTEDSTWGDWSANMIADLSEAHVLVINPIIYAEISVRFERIEDLESAIEESGLERRPLPWEAAFLAGKCHLKYRRQGGIKRSPMPDFYIGAHAAVEQLPLLTRDAKRFRAYFPRLDLLCPSGT